MAITLAFHAMSIGEDFENMVEDLDDLNDTDLGVTCNRKAFFDVMNDQLKLATNRHDTTKSKI